MTPILHALRMANSSGKEPWEADFEDADFEERPTYEHSRLGVRDAESKRTADDSEEWSEGQGETIVRRARLLLLSRLSGGRLKAALQQPSQQRGPTCRHTEHPPASSSHSVYRNTASTDRRGTQCEQQLSPHRPARQLAG